MKIVETHWAKRLILAGFAAGLCVCVACENSDKDLDSTVPESFKQVQFPDDFLWGTANATWQVEGDYPADGVTPETNWKRWTQMDRINGGQRNPAGVGFYTLYEEDFDRAAALGTNAFRFGISWARVEPENDQWNQAAIDHYVAVVKAARARGMQVMITFWHWTVPVWISDPELSGAAKDQLGVADNKWVQEQFAEFVAKVIPFIAADVDLYSILNEPWSMISGGYLAALFPPGQLLNIRGGQALAANLAFMHAKAAAEIRRLDKVDADGDGKATSIGIAKASTVMLPRDADDAEDVTAASDYNYVFNYTLIDAWTTGYLDINWDGDTTDTDTVPAEGYYKELENTIDWIGIQYYGPTYVIGAGPDAEPPFTGFPVPFIGSDSDGGYPWSEFDTQLRPDVYVATMEQMWERYKLPIYMTENGIADCDDDQRQRWLTEVLYGLGRAKKDLGIDLRGYFHWSLTDNFEWVEGRGQCFGLYAVNYDTFERTKRPSADTYKEIISKGVDWPLFLDAYKSGYGNDSSGRSVTDVVNEIEEEIANGISTRRTYRR